MEYKATRCSTTAIGVDRCLEPIPPERKRGEREWKLICMSIVQGTEVVYMWGRSTTKKRKRLPVISAWE